MKTIIAQNFRVSYFNDNFRINRNSNVQIMVDDNSKVLTLHEFISGLLDTPTDKFGFTIEDIQEAESLEIGQFKKISVFDVKRLS